MPDMKVPINPDTKEPEVDENCVGFNLSKENLRCLVVLSDEIAETISAGTAGVGFFRGFVVEDRKTGEIWAKQRFRYKDHDSWMHMHLDPERRKLPIQEQVQYFTAGFEKVLKGAMSLMAGKAKDFDEALRPDNGVPKGLITCFYPPHPEDAEATVNWLIEQDLVEVKHIYGQDGREVPVSGKGMA